MFTLIGALSRFDACAQSQKSPVVLLPKSALSAQQLGLVYNENDPLSYDVAEYYAQQRGIPLSNLFGISIPNQSSNLSKLDFLAAKKQLDKAMPAHVQALLLTWAKPYKVECMSITSAFAFGFDSAYCSDGCKPTKSSSYARVDTLQPYTDLGMRPTMLLPAETLEQAKQWIDRGVVAKNNQRVKAILLDTSNTARNVRSKGFNKAITHLSSYVDIDVVKADSVKNKKQIMFYFTGVANVAHLQDNQFLPGAIGDHLTSFGGQLFNDSNGQMSILKWLHAGAAGSYGAVVEPCNFIEKFPNPNEVMRHYLNGSTLIEAYWRSVLMPGQGLFVGEPLARPFIKTFVRYDDGKLIIKSQNLRPGLYFLNVANTFEGLSESVSYSVIVIYPWQDVIVSVPRQAFYRLSIM